jgi:3-deoxy-D-manno-octulosonate 8-phosphate phosphatase (KDO 8-P phosphatase)
LSRRRETTLRLTLTDEQLAERAAGLEWLLLDVDGVFTDGTLLYTANGEELKVFHVRDGLAVRLAQRGGLKVGVLSGRDSPALKRRALELGMDAVILGHDEKDAAFDAFLEREGTAAERVAYAGDDLLDLPVLRRAALSFAPADAVDEVLQEVDRVLESAGGRAAVRELVETLLRARGQWEELTAKWMPGGDG